MKNASLFSKKALAVACAMAMPGTALAQLEEVLVTATKRVESTQDIAMSVQAVSGDTLNSLSIDNFEDLATTIPNFTVGRQPNHHARRGFRRGPRLRTVGVYLQRRCVPAAFTPDTFPLLCRRSRRSTSRTPGGAVRLELNRRRYQRSRRDQPSG